MMNHQALERAIQFGIKDLPLESLQEIADFIAIVRLRKLHSSEALQLLLSDELSKLSQSKTISSENTKVANGVSDQLTKPNTAIKMVAHGDKQLPITPATEEPDMKALAGIWIGKGITLEKIRKAAWGDRL